MNNFNAQVEDMMANLAESLNKAALADMWRGANSLVCGDRIDDEIRRESLVGVIDWNDISFWALAH